MLVRYVALGLLVAAAGSALSLPEGDSRPWKHSVIDCDHELRDLDGYIAQDYDRILTDELDDVFQNGPANQQVAPQQMYNELMFALGDDGDTGLEDYMCLDDLEADMVEFGTTVSDVVVEAVNSGEEAGEEGSPAAFAAQVADGVFATPMRLVGRQQAVQSAKRGFTGRRGRPASQLGSAR